MMTNISTRARRAGRGGCDGSGVDDSGTPAVTTTTAPLLQSAAPATNHSAFSGGGGGTTLKPSACSRSAASLAYRISLVKANGDLGAAAAAAPSAHCQLLISPRDLSYKRHGYTDSVTQPAPVRHDSPRPGTAPAEASTCSGGDGPFPDASSVRLLLNAVLPRLALDKKRIAPVPASLHRPQRVYELKVSSPDMLVLVLGPPSMLRLLRLERWSIASEAVVIKWIRGVLLSAAVVRTTTRLDDDARRPPDVACPDSVRAHDDLLRDVDLLRDDVDLLELLPALLDHSPSPRELGSAYGILSRLDGLSISSLARRLSTSERRNVDFQAGRLIRRLSLLQSPSRKFGPAMAVLCHSSSRASHSIESPGGVDSWSLAFYAILEGILRDAEDMAVTISYHTIRRHCQRLSHYLDSVTVPRLVIIDAAHDSNMMAERTAKPRGSPARCPTLQNLLDSEDSEDSSSSSSRQTPGPDIRVTGLRDWSNCVFGDPLMATAFSETPSRDFLRGFRGRPRKYRVPEVNDPVHDDAYGDLAEFPKEAHIRLLLYQCYHGIVAVVKEFCRPQDDSSSRELAERKKLNAVLAKLEQVEDHPKRSHVRPSGEMSPAKKPRTDKDFE